MRRQVFSFLLLGCLCIGNFGCMAFVVGAASGAGTAVWLSGKLTQRVNYSFEKCIQASHQAMGTLKLEVTKETIQKNIAQIKGKYTDGKAIWVDIHRLTPGSCKIEVRVGVVEPDKVAADKILKEIVRNL